MFLFQKWTVREFREDSNSLCGGPLWRQNNSKFTAPKIPNKKIRVIFAKISRIFLKCRRRKERVNLMVDDGVSNRGHRKNMFSPDFKYVGIACGYHGAYDHCTVLDYAAGYGPKGSKQQGGNFGTSSNPTYTPTYTTQPIYTTQPVTTTYTTQPTTTYTTSQPTQSYQPTNNYSSGYGAPQSNPNLHPLRTKYVFNIDVSEISIFVSEKMIFCKKKIP